MLKRSKKFKILVLISAVLISSSFTVGCGNKELLIEDEYSFVSDGLTSIEVSLKTKDLDTRAIDMFLEKYKEYDLTKYQLSILEIIEKSDSCIDSSEWNSFEDEFKKLKNKLSEKDYY